MTPTPDPLRRAAANLSDRRTLMDEGFWVSQKEMRALDAALAQPAPALDVDLTVVREHLRKRITELSRPNGDHRYGRGGIHMDVSDCGECGRLHAFTAALQWLEPLGDPA